MSDFDSNRAERGIGRYPDATINAYLKQCGQITTDHGDRMYARFLKVLEEKFQELFDRAATDKDARHLQETTHFLSYNGAAMGAQFTASLREGFARFGARTLDTRLRSDEYHPDTLTLVENDDLEERIALSSIAHRAEERCGETLWFLQQRLAVLNEGRKVQEHNNPLSPLQFCEALRSSLATVALSTPEKILAYKYFEVELTEVLEDIYREVGSYLAAQGILPHLHTMSRLRFQQDHPEPVERHEEPASTGAAGTAPESSGQARTATEVNGHDPAGADPYASGIIHAIRTLQQHLGQAGLNQGTSTGPRSGPGPAAGPRTATGPALYTNQELVNALQTLQSQALGFTDDAANAPAGELAVPIQDVATVSRQVVEQLQQSSADGRVDPADMHTIDLVGMLFEYMLSDEQLPDSVKTILSYLHTPFLKMAFIDSTFFEKKEHPARLLLNSLAEAGTRWVGNDGTSQYEIYTKIRDTVSRVLKEFENDVRLFAELLLDFSSYVKKIARRQDLMEKRAMEKVQGEEKLREVKVRVNREIRSRTDGRELPSAVLLLLLQPWSDYLAFLLLRYGDNSESWKRAIAAVDQLIASIEAEGPGERPVQKQDMLDELMDTMEQGFDTIGYDQGRARKLLDALVSLQKMAMDHQKPSPAPAPMRSKWESEAAQKAGEQQGEQAITVQERTMVENLKMIEFGTWFEFDGGKRLKVAWYNSKTMQYMLVDQMGKKVAMKSGLELARGMLQGRARVIAGSSKPFFDRALDNILESLNAKAEAMQQETDHV
ncbi:DUF1631 domain-containing protein [Gilvimarinus sp. F26214L]|uniref:DUF1631 domain-containing protein n=1 Tax=Gilvimarinus sp. DZF01 TaxID=3461371 RepID=UPI0040455589